jgi:hypothetical protein
LILNDQLRIWLQHLTLSVESDAEYERYSADNILCVHELFYILPYHAVHMVIYCGKSTFVVHSYCKINSSFNIQCFFHPSRKEGCWDIHDRETDGEALCENPIKDYEWAEENPNESPAST